MRTTMTLWVWEGLGILKTIPGAHLYSVIPYIERRLLFYFRYRGTVITNRYAPGNGTIWFDNVHCDGHETSIAKCSHSRWGVHNCGHNEDVSVSCGTSPVQYGNLMTVTFNYVLVCLGI